MRLAGMRAQTLDANQAAEWKARNLGERWRNATSLYRGKMRLNLDAEELDAHYQRGEQARQAVFADIGKLYTSARALNVSEDRVIDGMRKAGIPAEVILGVADGGGYVAGERTGKESLSEIMARLASSPSEARAVELRRIAMQDPGVLRAIQDRLGEQARGVTSKDKVMLSMGVGDGARADYIVKKMRGLTTGEERVAYLKSLANSGALTPRVVEQVTERAAKR
jgi:hypothetical protein